MLAQETHEQEAQMPADTSRVILPGEGTNISSRGETYCIKLRSEDTDGRWALVEGVKPPMTAGPPLHIHTREDEALYILEGALRVQLGERIFTTRAGSVVYMPKGIPHTFCNPFNQPVHMLAVITPAGFERFFEETAALASKAYSMSQEEFAREQAEIGVRFGSIMIGPPLTLDPNYGL